MDLDSPERLVRRDMMKVRKILKIIKLLKLKNVTRSLQKGRS